MFVGVSTQNDAADTLEVFEKCVCDNFNYLIGALYVYKGLLVVFGLFLAYESRNVKYYYINDSRFTSIAVYIVVIVVGIGAPLSLVLSEHLFIDPAYSLTVLMVILATMACLLILFIPKVYHYYSTHFFLSVRCVRIYNGLCVCVCVCMCVCVSVAGR